MTPRENIVDLLRDYRKRLMSDTRGEDIARNLDTVSRIARIGALLFDEEKLTEACAALEDEHIEQAADYTDDDN